MLEDPEFKGNLGYVARPCLESNSNNKKQEKNKVSNWSLWASQVLANAIAIILFDPDRCPMRNVGT